MQRGLRRRVRGHATPTNQVFMLSTGVVVEAGQVSGEAQVDDAAHGAVGSRDSQQARAPCRRGGPGPPSREGIPDLAPSPPPARSMSPSRPRGTTPTRSRASGRDRGRSVGTPLPQDRGLHRAPCRSTHPRTLAHPRTQRASALSRGTRTPTALAKAASSRSSGTRSSPPSSPPPVVAILLASPLRHLSPPFLPRTLRTRPPTSRTGPGGTAGASPAPGAGARRE